MSELYTDEEMKLIVGLTQDFASVLNKFMDDNHKFSPEDRSCMIQHSLSDLVLSFIMAATEIGCEKDALDDMFDDIAQAIVLHCQPMGKMIN
jgi:hypothetical protein